MGHTCFNSIDIPQYSSKEILEKRLLTAIQMCGEIDGDGGNENQVEQRMNMDEQRSEESMPQLQADYRSFYSQIGDDQSDNTEDHDQNGEDDSDGDDYPY